ncbi:MAG TPA: DUF1707 domain-containing protein [Streptosporangiaceae bacterium]|nr:DUF1707 domain-containing protein [Streptosporangiaceae bacterium]
MPELRASDADREQAVDILCIAAGEGRLTRAELDERLEAALTARTIGELATVTADLPGGTTPPVAGQVLASLRDDPNASRWAVLRSLLASGGGESAQ